MRAFLADSFSDEEGSIASEGKTIYIQGSKQALFELCSFFEVVSRHLEQGETCHMHFQDYLETWHKETHIDVVVDMDQNAQ